MLSSIDWGDFPTWIGALFAGGAFAGALLLFRIESQRDDRAEMDARQSQARSVAVWLELVKTEEGQSLNFFLQNGSTSCVYDTYTVFYVGEAIAGYRPLTVLRPGPTPRTFEVPNEVINHPASGSRSGIMPALYFRDGGNLYWYRNKNGILAEIKSDDEGLAAAIRWKAERRVRQGRLH